MISNKISDTLQSIDKLKTTLDEEEEREKVCEETSTSPCRIRTNITRAKWTRQAPGIIRLRNADTAIAPPNILYITTIH